MVAPSKDDVRHRGKHARPARRAWLKSASRPITLRVEQLEEWCQPAVLASAPLPYAIVPQSPLPSDPLTVAGIDSRHDANRSLIFRNQQLSVPSARTTYVADAKRESPKGAGQSASGQFRLSSSVGRPLSVLTASNNGPVTSFAMSDNTQAILGPGGITSSQTLRSLTPWSTDLIQPRRTELVIVDPLVADYQRLVADLARDDSTRLFKVVVLRADSDGITQITNLLSQYHDLDAVHVITHGTGNGIVVGDSWVNPANLSTYAGQFQQWRGALAADADLLFYACNLAQNDVGQQLLQNIAAWTDADVAASADLTGSSALGGNWRLEFQSGVIDVGLAVSVSSQSQWQSVLAASVTVSTVSDIVNGDTSNIANLIAKNGGDGISLREAIIAANNTPGADDIFFSSPGTYSVTIGNPATGEDFAVTGDLDIRESLTIHGIAGGGVVIDASAMTTNRDRVFDLVAGTVVFDDLTIEGGTGGGSGGGGIFVRFGTTLTLDNCVLTKNDGNNGGAIQNDGTLIANFTTFTANSANSGGAIDTSGALFLTDVGISNNVASDAGGGIRNNYNATLNRVSIYGNSANQGGGIHNGSGFGAMSLTNVTISGNTAIAAGGGIWTNKNIDATNVTLAYNSVTTAVTGIGGGVNVNGGSGNLTMQNTILYNNVAAIGPNANRALATRGHNLSDATVIPTPSAGDQIGVDPLLAALANNGGFTPTHALLAGSPAINAGTATGAPTIDQRGYSRVGNTDIGAFEARSRVLDKIYWVDQTNNTIQRSNLDGSNVQTILDSSDGINSPTGLVLDVANGKIYWSEFFAGQIFRANLDGTGIQLIQSGLNSPAGLALDVANGMIYWTENPLLFGANSIRRASMNGGGPIQDLVTTVTNDPVDLALDLGAGKIYWTDGAQGEIWCANLDGTSASVVLSGLIRPQGLRLDLSARMMYWASDGVFTNAIQRANMDGAPVVQSVVTSGLNSPIGMELDIAQGKIYWSDWGTNKIQSANLDGSNVQDVVVTGLNLPIGIALGFSPNQNPVITSNGGGATVAISMAENTTAVTKVAATDADLPAQALTFAIIGGADATRFSINPTTGVLTFKAAPDYEVPTDADLNNVYELTVEVSDGAGGSDSQDISVAITAVNDNNPIITSNGGGATATISIAENTSTVTTVTATDADLPAQTLTYAIIGGADAARFTINGSTGVLAFKTAPDFESPTDVGLNNVYDVQVQVSDGSLKSAQSISVMIINVAESLVVDTTSDTVDGDTTSINALMNKRGADGRISLREAILAANNTPNAGVPDLITFNIPINDPGRYYYRDDGIAGSLTTIKTTKIADASITDFDPDYPYAQHTWFRIDLSPAASGQLTITDSVTIDGYSQPGATPNTLTVGDNANILIELTCTGADGNDGLDFMAGSSGSTVLGLAINRFGGEGIYTGAAGADSITIQGNFIGTDVTGTIDLGNGVAGVHLRSRNNQIGGPNSADRNIIAGNGYSGISIAHSNAQNNQLLGNYIGVDSSGNGPLGNAIFGVVIWDGANGNQIGDVTTGAGNVIAYNNRGVLVDANFTASINNSIRGNSIFSNTGLGIDLNNDGVSANDPGDSDLGANNTRNFPVITKASVSGGDLAVTGTINVRPNLICNIDFYWTLVGDSTNHGEGQNYIGTTKVATDSFGNASFNAIFFGASVPVGAVITATTTDASGNTSEFSLNRNAIAANSAPVLTGTNNLNPINEDPAANPGTLVSDLIAGHVTDADSGTQFGIAVIAVDNSNGTWQFSTDGGFSWLAFGSPSANSARLLAADSSTYVRFVPNPNWNGTVVGGITFRAWDQTSGMPGGTADVTGLTTMLDRFGNTSFSRNDGTANWSSTWVESDNSGGGASGGAIQVNGGRLDIRADRSGDWIYREANLSGATSAVLSMTYDNNLSGGDRIVIQLSNDGGVSYTTLTGGSFSSSSNTGVGSLSLDISPYISANTRVRFLVTNIGSSDHLYIDDLQITFSSSATVGTAAFSSATARADITVIPVNDEEMLVNNTGITVAENSTGTKITAAMLLTTDIDNPTNQLIYKVASIPTVGTLRLNGTALSVSDMFSQSDIDAGLLTYDHDGSESLTDSVTFVVDDGSGTASGGTFVITITPVNDNSPVITSNGGGANATVSIPENTTSVTTVTATDADSPAQKLTYSIIGGADAGRFTINSATGVLTFKAAPNYETPTDFGSNNVYDVIVQASDGSLTDTQSIAVSVTPVNEFSPVITSNGGGAAASVSIPENTAAVTTVVATDADLPAQTLTYSIIGGVDSSKFTIDPTTGSLTFNAAPDFENPTDIGLDNVYDVVVQASDGSFFDTQSVAVTVTPVNDNAPTITSNGGGVTATVNIPENTKAVTMVTATDTDLPVQKLTYSIIGGADAGKFTIESNTGVLSFNAAPDYENPTDIGLDNVYDVIVQTSDGNFIDSQKIAVTITPVNEFSPVITSNGGGAAASVSIPENTTAVTTVVATDVDLPAQTLTYAIIGGADAGRFTIDSTTGVLIFSAAPDYENPTDAGLNNVYDVIVQVSDGSLTDTQSIAISVTPVNEFSPVITSNGGGATASVTIPENTTAVTTVVATDADRPAQKLTYSIVGGADAGKFKIESGSGALKFISAPDYENPTDIGLDNVYDVIVEASDGSRTTIQAIAVTVTPTNETSPVITSNGGGVTASVIIPENNMAVTTVMATDADAPAQKLTFSIIGGADSGQFTIDNVTGVLSFSANPDFENPTDAGLDNVYDVIVQVSDGSLTDTQAITITVTPVNDNDPVITSNGGGATASVSLPENSTTVTTVTATDADLPAQQLRYSIIGGADAGKFTIDSVTGALRFNAAPDYENPTDAGLDNVYDVIVQASDGSLFDTQAIGVTVTNANEAPVAADNNYSISEDTTLVVSASGLLGNDTDADGDVLTSLIVSLPKYGLLALNTNGTFTYTPFADFYGVDSFTYQARDGVFASLETKATINVMPVNDAPVAGGDSFAVDSDTKLTVAVNGVLRNDSDVDGNQLAAELVSPPDNGTIALRPDGSFTYVPNSKFTGIDTFRYRTDDGQAKSNVVTVSIDVKPSITATPLIIHNPSPNPSPVPVTETPPNQSSGQPNSNSSALILAGTTPWSNYGNSTHATQVEPDVSALILPPKPAVPAIEVAAATPTLSDRNAGDRSTLSLTIRAPDSVESLPTRSAADLAPDDPVFTALNQVARDLKSEAKVQVVADAVVATGVVVSAGYVLLNTKIMYWFISALLVRPAVWSRFDPIDVLYAWDEDDDDSKETADNESLQSMVS